MAAAILIIGWKSSLKKPPSMMELVEKQLSFGPRIPDSEGHAAFIEWAKEYLKIFGWTVQAEPENWRGKEIINIIAERDPVPDDTPWIILGAHYDTRTFADEDAIDRKSEPVPGANDGASGVAVLLKLAETLPDNLNKRITLALFDAEDQGNITGWGEWCIGSSILAEQIKTADRKPDAVVIVDMIGDADLNIYEEKSSNAQLKREIWNTAIEEGFGNHFISEEKYSIHDDHTPFLEIGIPAVDLIDFDYPYWHTTADTADKLSEESLSMVEQTVRKWLLK